MSTAIVEYTPTEAALAELRHKYDAVVFDPSTTKGMAEAKAARAELRTLRIALETKRKEIKAPALLRCKEIDTEAQRITAELSALEDPIDETIKAEEQRKEREKAERERIEAERIEARNKRFDAIRAIPLRAINATAAQIETLIAETCGMDVSDLPTDLQPAANYEIGISVLSLRAALDARRLEDARAEQLRKDQEELARLRAEQEKARAEQERFAAIERECVAAEQRQAEAKARAEREAAERAAREAAEAEQRRIDAEHEAAMAEERRLEALARAERDAIEKAEREARAGEQARIDAERAEARRKEDAERVAAQEALRKEQAKAAAERERLAKEAADAKKAARAKSIAEATLLSAANDAVELLRELGQGEHLVTQKLESAIRREPSKTKKAA